MRRKKSNNLYIKKKKNLQNVKDLNSSGINDALKFSGTSLIFWVIGCAYVFLYSQILQTVEGNASLAIMILQSYQVAEIPIIISPYLTLVLFILFCTLVPPSMLSLSSLKLYRWVQARRIKVQTLIFILTLILCEIYGLILCFLYTIIFDFIYGNKSLTSASEFTVAGYLHYSTLFSIPVFILLVAFPLLLGDTPTGDLINQKLTGNIWRAGSFEIAAKLVIITLVAITIVSPQSINDFTDTRNCIKFINGYSPFEKVFDKGASQNNSYYITGYSLKDSGDTLSIVVSGIGVNPINKEDFISDQRVIYADKKVIDFINPGRCGLYLDTLYKSNYYK